MMGSRFYLPYSSIAQQPTIWVARGLRASWVYLLFAAFLDSTRLEPPPICPSQGSGLTLWGAGFGGECLVRVEFGIRVQKVVWNHTGEGFRGGRPRLQAPEQLEPKSPNTQSQTLNPKP